MTGTLERSVDIQLQAHDLTTANKLQFLQGLRSRRGLIIIAVLAAVTTTLLALLIWDGDDVVTIAIIAVFSPLIVVSGPAFVVWFIAPRTARRIYAQQASLRQPYRLEWSEQYYIAQSDTGHAKIPWRDFFRVQQNDEMIVLFESQVLRRLIPLRFLSMAQRKDIERIIAVAGKGPIGRRAG